MKPSTSPLMKSILYIPQYPTVIIFPGIRAALCTLLAYALSAQFLGKAEWRLLTAGTVQQLFGLFDNNCYKSIPCGIIFLYLFFVVSMWVSVATISYVLEQQAKRATSPFQVVAHSIQRIPYILAWGLFFAPVYFAILNQQFQVCLLIAPWIILATFFVPATIAHKPVGMIDTLISSLQELKYNFVHTILFLIMFAVTVLILGLGILQYARSPQILMVLWLLISVLATIRDIFAGLAVDHATLK